MNNQKILKPYWVTDDPGEWAMLVFHYNRQQAKVLGWQNWPFLQSECDYLMLRVTRAHKDYTVFKDTDKNPHVVDTWSDKLKDMDSDFEIETWQSALNLLKQNMEVEA